MVQQHGLCHIKTAEDRETERQVKERKQEHLESYRAQSAEKRETVSSTHSRNIEMQRINDAREESTTLERRRRTESDEIEGGVSVRQALNGLHSVPAPKPPSYSELPEDRQLSRRPSFRLNAGKQ